MIRIGTKEISRISFGRVSITAVYKGARLVWQAVSSCFGSGWWRGDQPWKGSDGWRGRP